MSLSSDCGELFSEDYRKLILFAGRVAEAQKRRAERIPEKVVQSIWMGEYFRSGEGFTEEGKPLRVISPGRWNPAEGPDFTGAIVELAGELVQGDVEIHLAASDWSRHGHDSDPAYNGVMLHVVIENDIDAGFVQRADGAHVPQLVLEQLLDVELGVLSEVVDSEMQPEGLLPKEAACRYYLAKRWDAFERIGRVLDKAGDERMLAKARKAERSAGAAGIEQGAYELLMECMGYERNKVQFLVLARRATLRELKALAGKCKEEDRATAVEAALVGVAGLLNMGDDEHFRKLKEMWQEWGAVSSERVMTAYKWHFGGGRPTNSPLRRIAAMSHLIVQNVNEGLLTSFLRPLRLLGEAPYSLREVRSVMKQFETMFTSLEDDYWSHRISPKGKLTEKAQRLVGRERFKTIFINAVIPLLLLHARGTGNVSLERTTHWLYCSAGRLAPDRITRRVCRLVFGREDEPRVVSDARRQQGLHQIYRDFCSFGQEGCRGCAMADALAF